MKTAGILKRLDQLEKKTTEEEDRKQLEAAVASVEAWYQECKRKFNSLEEVARRKQEYAELQAEGKQRKKEFYERLGEKI